MYFFMGNFMKLIRVVVRIIKINIYKRWVSGMNITRCGTDTTVIECMAGAG